MSESTGGEGAETAAFAPVTPLFGDRAASGAREPSAHPRSRASQDGPAAHGTLPSAPGTPPLRATRAAPVEDSAWHATWLDDEQIGPDDPAALEAERQLLKRLRTRSLSVCEAHAVLTGHDLPAETVAGLLERAQRYGYLDDARLADSLVASAVERKGHGRQAIARTLSQRGIPREAADAALARLPDDEADRALAFARKKVSGLADLDRQVALRRLTGQLARRGYGAAAMTAARQALDEAASSHARVRFEE